jgi:hypothetical protein
VLVALALDARHDGRGARLAAELVAAKTGLAVSTVHDQLARLRGWGEVRLVRDGGGRGRVAEYRVVIRRCRDACWSCETLSAVLKDVTAADAETLRWSEGKKKPVDKRVRPPEGKEKGSAERRVSERNPPTDAIKGPTDAINPPVVGPTTVTGTEPPPGGSVPHRESAPPAACGGAGGAEPGPGDTRPRRLGTARAILARPPAANPTAPPAPRVTGPPPDPETLAAEKAAALAAFVAAYPEAAGRGPPSPNGAQPDPDPAPAAKETNRA